MKYTNDNRGQFQNLKRARQVIEFSGIQYGNSTPTDIDGYIERENLAFVFYELKLRGANISKGQSLALTRIVDNLELAGKDAVLLLAYHDVKNPDNVIRAADAEVIQYYWKGGWHPTHGKSLKYFTDEFMKYVLPPFML